MSDLEKAMMDLRTIRAQMARGTVFRGFGPTTLAATGFVALLAAVIQSLWLPEPEWTPLSYAGLWGLAGLLCAALIGVETVTRSHRLHSGLADDMLRAAIEQFLPAAVAGFLLTVVILRFASDQLWMLPGLWQVVFSLGVFSACRSLPAQMILVAMFYLTSGIISFALLSFTETPAPWAMGGPFFVGQALAALLLQYAGDEDAEEE